MNIETLNRAIGDVVAPQAQLVDREGRFPRASIDRLAADGLLGICSGADVGGGGEGLRTAATVVEKLAGACGSTAMVVMMHYAATTLWYVPATTPGLAVGAPFDGLGLRGNASSPMTATSARVAADAGLGGDGEGLDVALAVVLPWFLVLNAAVGLGLMEAVTSAAASHLQDAQLEHLGVTLSETPLPRRDLARMRIETDRTRALLDDSLTALESGRDDASLRVLEVKAAAGEAAATVTDLALQVGGGSAFRRETPIERHFRDARAARVMAPTTDALYDFVGRALLGLPLLEA